MAVHKVIQIATDGKQSEYTGKASSAGASDSGEFIIADANGKLDVTYLPTGVGADALAATAGEALNAGDFVYISGTGTVLKADATSFTKRAMGYVLTAVANAATATVYFDDSNSALTGLTIGAKYFLSATSGQATATAPVTSGQFVQPLGIATSATSIHVSIGEPIQRA